MKMALWMFLTWSAISVANTDPFIKPAKKIILNQRYQYLGYVKYDKQIWAYIKPVSRDIERVGLGHAPGLGLVKTIKANKVCLEKSNHIYCLYKSTQAGVWR